MNARVARLRERSLAHRPTISAERAVLLTEFYSEHAGQYPVPILRAGVPVTMSPCSRSETAMLRIWYLTSLVWSR